MKTISGLTPKEFTNKFYKNNRLQGRNKDFPGYSEMIIKNNEIEFETTGECCISKHESILCEFTKLIK